MSTTIEVTNTVVFERWESPARNHGRRVNATFDTASGSILREVDGRTYIDFLSGAGSLTYGHNDPEIRAALIEYLMRDGFTHTAAPTPNSSGPRCSRDGGQGDNHCDAPGFQRRGAVRRS